MSFTSGYYQFNHPGGTINVCLRNGGVFYCPQFPVGGSTWYVDINNVLQIDWKKYGKYELEITAAGTMEGGVVGNHANWRKMVFISPLTNADNLLIGNGGGSVWNFEFEGGAFEVEFRCDSLNHFICNTYPAHSHWSTTNDTNLTLNWDKYGIYELVIDPASSTMTGCKQGQPSNWRKATFLRGLNIDTLSSVPSHDHAHIHGEHCKH